MKDSIVVRMDDENAITLPTDFVENDKFPFKFILNENFMKLHAIIEGNLIIKNRDKNSTGEPIMMAKVKSGYRIILNDFVKKNAFPLKKVDFVVNIYGNKLDIGKLGVISATIVGYR
jgi:hypothetical protein